MMMMMMVMMMHGADDDDDDDDGDDGKQHAKEISNMALRLMREVDGFKVLMDINSTSRVVFSICPR